MNYDCLIVDDEKLLCDSTAEYFNLFGIKTATAYSTGECLSFLEHNKTCLLLLDINLGDGSGLHCAENSGKRRIFPFYSFPPVRATTTR